MRDLDLTERLIVVADYQPSQHGGPVRALEKFMTLAQEISGSGVVIRLGSLLRYRGYQLIEMMHDLGIKVMADLDLRVSSDFLRHDMELLMEFKPELLTVVCPANAGVLRFMQAQLSIEDDEYDGEEEPPRTIITEILGKTARFNDTAFDMLARSDDFERVTELAIDARLGGVILTAQELSQANFQGGLSRNCAGIRPAWSIERGTKPDLTITTPCEAIQAGADRIMVDGYIANCPNPRRAVNWTLDEIQKGLEARGQ